MTFYFVHRRDPRPCPLSRRPEGSRYLNDNSEIMGTDGICDKVHLYTEAVPAVPPPPLHVREYCSFCPIRLLHATLTVVVGTCGTLLLHTDSSDANP